jgi:hypothetical protein
LIAERVLIKLQLASFGLRPCDAAISQVLGKETRFEGAVLKYAVVGIYLFDQIAFDALPAVPDSSQRIDINWYAGSLHTRHGGHVAAAEECLAQRLRGWCDAWQHGLE